MQGERAKLADVLTLTEEVKAAAEVRIAALEAQLATAAAAAEAHGDVQAALDSATWQLTQQRGLKAQLEADVAAASAAAVAAVTERDALRLLQQERAQRVGAAQSAQAVAAEKLAVAEERAADAAARADSATAQLADRDGQVAALQRKLTEAVETLRDLREVHRVAEGATEAARRGAAAAAAAEADARESAAAAVSAADAERESEAAAARDLAAKVRSFGCRGGHYCECRSGADAPEEWRCLNGGRSREADASEHCKPVGLAGTRGQQ